MKVKAFAPCMAGEPVKEAQLKKRKNASPILVIEEVGPMGPIDLFMYDYRIISATTKERESLVKAGYIEFASEFASAEGRLTYCCMMR
jgi:hypothetical protein